MINREAFSHFPISSYWCLLYSTLLRHITLRKPSSSLNWKSTLFCNGLFKIVVQKSAKQYTTKSTPRKQIVLLHNPMGNFREQMNDRAIHSRAVPICQNLFNIWHLNDECPSHTQIVSPPTK